MTLSPILDFFSSLLLRADLHLRQLQRAGVRGGDPDEAAWDELTPAVAFNLLERNFVQSWPVGIYQARSAKGNVIGENSIKSTLQDVVAIGRGAK